MAENIQICNGVTEDMGNQIDDIVKDMSELKDTTASAADTTEYSLNMIENFGTVKTVRIARALLSFI